LLLRRDLDPEPGQPLFSLRSPLAGFSIRLTIYARTAQQGYFLANAIMLASIASLQSAPKTLRRVMSKHIRGETRRGITVFGTGSD
jgi:hypothetical protein